MKLCGPLLLRRFSTALGRRGRFVHGSFGGISAHHPTSAMAEERCCQHASLPFSNFQTPMPKTCNCPAYRPNAQSEYDRE